MKLNDIFIIGMFLIGLQAFTILISCSNPKKQQPEIATSAKNEIQIPKLQGLLDSKSLNGGIIIYDEAKREFYTNKFSQPNKGTLPASTFKIANSIIGLEIGVIENQFTIFDWDGETRMMKSWEENLTLRQAFQRSCVPCYQELARSIGLQNMKSQLKKINYQGMDIHQDNLDSFWLTGKSKISPRQQINFLRRLASQELPISEHTFDTMMKVMIAEETNNYVLRAKSGLSVGNGPDMGWYVGWIQTDNNKVYFATRLSPVDADLKRSEFTPLRKEVTMEALRILKYL